MVCCLAGGREGLRGPELRGSGMSTVACFRLSGLCRPNVIGYENDEAVASFNIHTERPSISIFLIAVCLAVNVGSFV